MSSTQPALHYYWSAKYRMYFKLRAALIVMTRNADRMGHEVKMKKMHIDVHQIVKNSIVTQADWRMILAN